jgi:hypothetical protein
VSRKRRQPISSWSLGNIPVTPVKTVEGYETWKEMQAREAREAKERAEAPMKALQSEFSKNLRELRAIQRAKLERGEPSEILAERCTPRPTGEIPDADVLIAARVGLEGISLTKSGRAKVVAVFRMNPTIDPANAANWREVFDYLVELDVMSNEDVPGIEKPAPQPVAETPNLDNLSTDNREHRQMVTKLFQADVAAFFDLWAESLYKNFGYSFYADPNYPALLPKMQAYLVKWNLNPLSHETWNQIRRAFGKLGLMPLMLTETEKLNDLIESADMNDRETRMAIAQKANVLAGR